MTGGMEVKYFSLLDVCIVRAVKVMTAHGLGAADAIWIAHHPFGVGVALRSLLSEVEGVPTLLGIQPGNRDKGEKFTFSLFRSKQFAATMADSGGIMTVFDLDAVNQHVLKFFDRQK
ncbi:hypothetical protein J6497_20510 [Bradyrhizobium sp. CNPSo 4026]|nr:hypothetical protein [Bradyrhizobium cenepequi]MCA6109594.1 hypothetical protein [Bradyrhizobium cenepequi]